MNYAGLRQRYWAKNIVTGVSASLTGLFVAPVLASQALGQLEPSAFSVEGVSSYSFHSPILDRTYVIDVGFPKQYQQNPQRQYPALIVTDGNIEFAAAQGAARRLAADAMGGGAGVEPLVIIGIGPPLKDGDAAWVRRRVYDFSPPDWGKKADFSPYMKDFCRRELSLEPQQCVGGARKFLQFITAELLPRLAKLHRINLDDLALFGHSAGGFFASWAIFQKDSPFKRYIVSSPAMMYGDGEIWRQEELYAAAHQDLPIAVYLSSGALEIEEAGLEDRAQIVSGQAHLASCLRGRKYPHLVLYSELQAGLGHEDVAPTALARALRLLFKQGNVP